MNGLIDEIHIVIASVPCGGNDCSRASTCARVATGGFDRASEKATLLFFGGSLNKSNRVGLRYDPARRSISITGRVCGRTPRQTK